MEIFKLNQKENKQRIYSENLEALFSDKNSQHLIIVDVNEFISIKNVLSFPEKACESTIDGFKLPNAEFYDNLLYITLNDIGWKSSEKRYLHSREINIFLGKNFLFLIYHEISDTFKNSVDKIDGTDIYKALYSFIDFLLDNNKKLINEIEFMATDLEDKILQTIRVYDNKTIRSKIRYVDPDIYIDELVNLRKLMHYLKKYYGPTADIIEIIEVDESKLIPAEYDKYFLKLSLKADRTSNSLVSLRDYISQVRESWQAQVDLNFNKVMKIFTVITAIFLPLTLIAGWYGMNFKYMPELSWHFGYGFAFALSGLVVLLCLWLFKKNHYI